MNFLGNPVKRVSQFVREVKGELSKVSWSTREELIGATSVVLVITAIMAGFFGVIDVALSKILSIVFR